jgi:hypothetical protein
MSIIYLIVIASIMIVMFAASQHFYDDPED